MMNDTVSRQAVQEMVDRIGCMYPYRQIGNRESYSQYNEAWTDVISRVDAELNSLPSALPDRKLIDGYMWKIMQNISPSTSADGVVAIKYYLERIYEQIYGEGEKLNG